MFFQLRKEQNTGQNLFLKHSIPRKKSRPLVLAIFNIEKSRVLGYGLEKKGGVHGRVGVGRGSRASQCGVMGRRLGGAERVNRACVGPLFSHGLLLLLQQCSDRLRLHPTASEQS